MDHGSSLKDSFHFPRFFGSYIYTSLQCDSLLDPLAAMNLAFDCLAFEKMRIEDVIRGSNITTTKRTLKCSGQEKDMSQICELLMLLALV